jgi:chemotaxis response regulator CheB
MSMRTLIVDDEAAARGRLKRPLADFEGVELIGEVEGGVQAVEMIERGEPELALPDT